MLIILKKIYNKLAAALIRKPLTTMFVYKYFPKLFLWARFSRTKNKNSQQFWDEIHQQETGSANRFDNFVLRFLARVDFSDKDVLDVGCGRGTFLSQITNARSLTGVDFSRAAVEMAAAQGITGLVRKLPDLNLDKTFDIITCFETLEHTAHWKKSIEEMVKILKADGLLIISVPFENSIIIDEHLVYFDLWRLYKFLKNKLSVREIKILGPWMLLIAQKKKFVIGERPDYFFKDKTAG